MWDRVWTATYSEKNNSFLLLIVVIIEINIIHHIGRKTEQNKIHKLNNKNNKLH